MKELRVTVDGKVFDVSVEFLDDPSKSLWNVGTGNILQQSSVSAPTGSMPKPKQPAAAAPGDVVSPLAGRVVTVDCKEGQAVAVGDKLVTIEAMKMNTFVVATAAGSVSAIHVKPGDAVEESQALVTVA